MNKALFIIDVQNYFISPYTKDLPSKIEIYIKRHKEDFDLIVFTNFMNTPTSSSYRLLGWKECLEPPDIELAKELQSVLSYGVVVSKDTLSALKVSKIKKLLEEKNIAELYICGIDTDCCVLATAYDAFDEGYKVTVLKNLSMTHTGKNLHEVALRMIKRNIGAAVDAKI